VPGASIDYTTPSLMAVYWLKEPADDWNVFAKLGLSAIDNSASSALIPFEKQTDIQLAAGVGARLRFANRWFVRGDVDLYDRDHYYAGLAIGAYFGSRTRSIMTPRAEPVPVPVQAAAPPAKPEARVPLAPPPQPALVCEDIAGVLEGVQFENDAAALLPKSREILNDVVRRLKATAAYDIEVRAHTDSNGSQEYNYALSNRRAQSVEDYLASKGIARDRLSSRGIGELNPIADNATAAGRAKNRRVELRWTAEQCD
jgi:outer membrane protein OmpA-like peptidoglycan-associated protein